MSSYQPGIPTGLINLDTDYQNIQNNFMELNTQFGIDHVPFANFTPSISGYHTNIHLNPFSTTATNPPNNYNAPTASPVGLPTPTTGFGQLFSAQVNDGVNTDTALFWQSGGGLLIELTRNLAPNINSQGYTSIPGGLIIQWGFQAISGSSSDGGTIKFTDGGGINFPNNNFIVLVTLICKSSGTSSSDNTLCVGQNSIKKTGFGWQYNGNGGNYIGFFWFALGN